MSSEMPDVIEVKSDGTRKLISGYTSIFALLIVSTLIIVPFLIPYLLQAFSNSGTVLDADEITRDQIVPALFATFAAEIIVVVAFILFAGDRRRWRAVLGFERFSWKTCGVGLAVGITFFLGLLGLELLASALDVSVGNSDSADQFGSLSGALKLFVLFVCVPVLAPLLEEVFFRGLMLGHLLEGHGGGNRWADGAGIVAWSVFWSSIWFSLSHFQGASSAIDFVVLAWTFAFACTSCVLRIKFRSLYPSMTAHSSYNLLSAVGIVLG